MERRAIIMLDILSEHPAGIRPNEWRTEARKKLEKEGISLSKEVFYRNIKYLMRNYIKKSPKSTRNFALYYLVDNPYRKLAKECSGIQKDIQKYMNLVEKKERKKEISQQEATWYITDALNFISYILMKTMALAEKYPEDEDVFYQLAGKTIRNIGHITYPFIARDEHERRFKELLLKEVLETTTKDKELEKYSSLKRIKKLVRATLKEEKKIKEKKIDVTKAIKVVKITAKIKKT